MADREQLFARIRAALDTPAERQPGHGSTALPVVQPARSGPRPWLPVVGASPAEWLSLFSSNCVELKTELTVVQSMGEARRHLKTMASDESWARVAAHHAPLIDDALSDLANPQMWLSEGYAVEELEQCSVGITACDALIAQTGSILVTSQSAGGRALSVLPPHHVVIATADQVLPDLLSAYDLLYERYRNGWPSMISLITGPSRTGDIERIIVLGAHGPRRLSIILIDPR